jgi:hypothetical protein
MKKSILVLTILTFLIVASKKMFAGSETGGKVHECVWVYITPTEATLACIETGTFCAGPSDCVVSN